MKGIFFDMDGVLLDSMPYHAEAMYQALKIEINYDLDKKWIFLLEGMPAEEFLNELFKINPPKATVDKNLISKIVNLKKKIFKEMENITIIDGAKEILEELNKTDCIKAIVSGSSRKEAQHIIEKKIGILNFDIVITGDDVTKGKPDPQPFTTALDKTNLAREDVLIVENSPFGVMSAYYANIDYIITLNSTPLTTLDFFNFLPLPIKNEFNKYIFKDIRLAKGFILDWIYKT
jgi:beta-phosphoglucomutase-like phosphatase (HAD superfamily)